MCGAPFDMMQTSFFLSRQTLLSADKPGMAVWREKLFAWMMRNSATPMEFFRLPTNRVVELGVRSRSDDSPEGPWQCQAPSGSVSRLPEVGADHAV